jgi:hypothetical protein
MSEPVKIEPKSCILCNNFNLGFCEAFEVDLNRISGADRTPPLICHKAKKLSDADK